MSQRPTDLRAAAVMRSLRRIHHAATETASQAAVAAMKAVATFV